MNTATFAAGCFWGVEETFRQTEGVVETQVGYIGGQSESPDYKTVCTGNTGHAEAVEVPFDPARVTYQQLLDVFWQCHNPTQLNRQGPDFGTQYRTAIFTHGDEQMELATASRQHLDESGRLGKPIATEIVAASVFHRAEEYHQQYIAKGGRSSCHI